MNELARYLFSVTDTEKQNQLYIQKHNKIFSEEIKPKNFLNHHYNFSDWYPEEVCFKKNSRWSAVAEHSHNYIEMAYVYNGTVSQKINEEEIILNQNDLIILDTNTIHTINYTSEQDILLNYSLSKNLFNTNFFGLFSEKNIIMKFLIQTLYEDQKNRSYLLFRDCSEEIAFLLNKLTVELINDELEKELVTTDLLRLIFVELIRSQHNNIVVDSKKIDAIIFQIQLINFIEENLQKITLEMTANMFGYNYSYFSQIVKESFGKNWTDLVQEIRINQACELLTNTTLTIREIANTVGIENSSFFYRVFRHYKGSSPKEYRNKKMT